MQTPLYPLFQGGKATGKSLTCEKKLVQMGENNLPLKKT